MNHLLGTVFTALLTDENETHYFVQKEGRTFSLRKEEGAHVLGEAVKGFGYLNSSHKEMFTTQIPNCRVGHFSFGEVMGVRRDLGVFVAIGLPDKDVVVSLDDLPQMRELWPKVGDKLMISLKVDEKSRMWGELASEELFRSKMQRGLREMLNQDVIGTVFRLKLVGTYFVTEEQYIGFIHPSERFREPRLGEKVQARVIGTRPDGVLNCSLKPRAHESIEPDAQMILTFLERSATGEMDFSDKSTPEDIKALFGISKGQFKRALGNLMKAKKIEQVEGKTRLRKEESEKEVNACAGDVK